MRTRFATFFSGAASRYATAALVAGVAYSVLYAMHDRYLSKLGLTSSDVGLDRERLLGGPVIGLAVAFLGFAAIVLLVMGAMVGGAFLATRLGASTSPWLRAGIAALIFFVCAAVFVVLVLTEVTLTVQLLVYAAMVAAAGAFTGAATGAAPSSRKGALMVFIAVLFAIAFGAACAFAVGYGVADEDARLVKAGWPAASRELFGLPLIATDARRVQFAAGRLGALDRDTRGHLECLLSLGRNADDEVLWDVRRQRALRVQLPDGAFAVTGSEQPVPAHCAPEPDPGDDEVLLSGRPVAAVRTSGSITGWQERLHGRWLLVIARGQRAHRLGPSWAARPAWDVGPGRRRGTLSAVAAGCAADRCTLRWWRTTTRRAHDLPLAPGQACALDAVAAAAAAPVIAWSGERCRQRGLWRRVCGRWQRLAPVRPHERIVSVDLDRDRVAWIAAHEGEWSVATRPLRSGRVGRVAVHRGALLRGDLRMSSVALAGDRVRWATSRAFGAADRTTSFIEARHGRCRVVADEVPGRPDGSGLDAAIVDGRVLYARGRMLGWHELDGTRGKTGCAIPFAIGR